MKKQSIDQKNENINDMDLTKITFPRIFKDMFEAAVEIAEKSSTDHLKNKEKEKKLEKKMQNIARKAKNTGKKY